MYVYDLPYVERKSLCRILDVNSSWEQLGGAHMKFDMTILQNFHHAPSRNRSPTDEMLILWGNQNHTVLELFVLLSRMQHYQAMQVLKPLVDAKYHRLIYEGEENFSRILRKNICPRSESNTTINQAIKQTDGKEINGNLNENISPNKDQGQKMKVDKSMNEVINFQNEAKLDDKLHLKKENYETVFNELSLSIPYADLENAAGLWDRKNILGKGGFGTVYKGFWKNTEVAIKRLELQKGEGLENESCRTDRRQSLRELKFLTSCRHDNILPLYGFSIGGSHDCLVYQYMPNGSLEDRLQCREGSKPLTWHQRHMIAIGTARGLQYLHTYGDKPLVHGDIKSANILLDPYFVPKIGDFGLAREGPLQQYTHVKVSRVHGTKPYLPDEFLRSKKFSTKVDTYSFGIVLFELGTGLRAYDDYRQHKYLRDYVDSTNEEIAIELRDLKAGYFDECNTYSLLMSMGRRCISYRAKDRPEMVDVLQRLDLATKSYDVTQQAHLVCYSPMIPAMSQQRRLSLSPNFISPIGLVQIDNSPIVEGDSSRQISPKNSVPSNTVPLPGLFPHPVDNLQNRISPVPGPPPLLRVSKNLLYPLTNSSSEETSEEEINKTPMIRIDPPFMTRSNESPYPMMDENGLSNDLPLISALGIKDVSSSQESMRSNN